jgi:hypothetical protein
MWGRLTVFTAPAARFLRWWLAELSGLIPSALRDLLNNRSRLATIDIDAAGAVLAGSHVPPPGTRCRLRIPASAVAGKLIALPESATDRLSAVLRFQVEQETPFRADDVVSDHLVVRRDRKAKRVIVDWRLVPKPVVERAVQRAGELGLRVRQVGIASDDPAVHRFDFHRLERADTRQANRFVRPVLAATLGLLVLAAVATPLMQKLAAVGDL